MSIGRSKDYKPLKGFSKTGDKPDDKGSSIHSSNTLSHTPTNDSENFTDKTRDDKKVASEFHSAPPAPTNVSPATTNENDADAKQFKKDNELLGRDRWLVRNGHFVTFIGLYLFSIMVLFRPYELVPGLGFLAFTAAYFAIATLLIYAPSQLTIEGNLTMLSTEIKAVLAMVVLALITLPIARSPALAWESFNE